jgi:DNA-directed RNA polymerase subunit alpha
MQKPKFYLETIKENSSEGNFVISPLNRGFGNTIGNVLRRTLLSSLDGAAVTYVRIKGISHSFDTIKGLKEDVLSLILNLKLLRFNFSATDEQKLILKKKGPAKVTAADIQDSPLCKVVNKDLYIGELAQGGSLEIEIYVDKGTGYISSEEKDQRDFGIMPVDSTFTPVNNVIVNVTSARVGERTDFDKLTLTVFTDGSVKPSEALNKAVNVVIEHFSLLSKGGATKEIKPEKTALELEESTERATREDMMVDELDLPTRVINALIKHGIETVGQLKNMTDDELAEVRGLGKKSVKELNDKLLEI